MGVAVGSVLFLRWLQLSWPDRRGSAALYGMGSKRRKFSLESFQSSWTVIAGLAAIAIVTSAMRGKDERKEK